MKQGFSRNILKNHRGSEVKNEKDNNFYNDYGFNSLGM